MFPIEAARLMSFDDVEYRRHELTREFAAANRGRARRALRRDARRRRAAANRSVNAPAIVPGTTLTGGRGVARPEPISTRRPAAADHPVRPPVPTQVHGSADPTTVDVVDDRLPVA
jgi:hypothetical protein